MSALPEAIVRRKEGAESARLGRDCVVLDAAGQMLRGLNGSAARVWELADGTRSLAEMSHQIASEYSLPTAHVLRDVLSFVEQLLSLGLLEYADADPSRSAR